MTLSKKLKQFIISLSLLTTGLPTYAMPTASVKSSITRAEEGKQLGSNIIIPYAFNTESMGLNVGLGYIRKGFLQEQLTVGITGFGGDSAAAAGGIWNLRIPGTNRLFASAIAMSGEYPILKAYAQPRDTFTPADEPRYGSHYSSQDQNISTQGGDSWLDLRLEYVLPFGAAKDKGFIEYKLRDGLLASKPTGGQAWNPIKSGVSVISLRNIRHSQIYRIPLDITRPNYRSSTTPAAPENLEFEGKTDALELGLYYNNTDFAVNPSTGSSQFIAYTQDETSTKDSDDWNFIEIETSKYFSLGATQFARQRVIAINGWLGYSPSWEYITNEQGDIGVKNSPFFREGAKLGGFDRMRGYDANRFHDKAAIYTAAEYRYTLQWNPLLTMPWIEYLNIDWIQLIAFTEGGRVAPAWNKELLSNWRSDVGLGARLLASGLILRFDMAKSTESFNAWVMVSQAF